jgi:hypothetical protein
MAKIVVSYRRSDSKWITGRIFEHLETRFGRGNVFMDIDNVPLGRDYRNDIRKALAECDVLIAVVGPKWKEELDKFRDSHSDENPDWVRLEIGTALERQIPVSPVLIDGTKMPSASELPDDLREFAFRQAARFDTEDFKNYIQRLTAWLEKVVVPTRPPLAEPVIPKGPPREDWRTKIYDRSRNIFAAKVYGSFAGLLLSLWIFSKFTDWASGMLAENTKPFYILLGGNLCMLVVSLLLAGKKK